MNGQTYDGVKEQLSKKTTLELLQVVMYGNRNTGDVDQAYEEIKTILKAQNELLKLYQYLNENTNDYDLNPDEVDEIHNKIYELEEELK